MHTVKVCRDEGKWINGKSDQKIEKKLNPEALTCQISNQYQNIFFECFFW